MTYHPLPVSLSFRTHVGRNYCSLIGEDEENRGKISRAQFHGRPPWCTAWPQNSNLSEFLIAAFIKNIYSLFRSFGIIMKSCYPCYFQSVNLISVFLFCHDFSFKMALVYVSVKGWSIYVFVGSREMSRWKATISWQTVKRIVYYQATGSI